MFLSFRSCLCFSKAVRPLSATTLHPYRNTSTRTFSINPQYPKLTLLQPKPTISFPKLLSTSSNPNENASSDGKRRSQETYQQIQKEKNKSLAFGALALIVAVVGLSYAAVPLYTLFCQATGFGGTTRNRKGVSDLSESDVDLSRPLTVHFTSDVSGGMPWTFEPVQKSVRVVPGESTLVFYVAHNRSKVPITGVATYNVTPQKSGSYFNKVQCFCFDEQKLEPGEEVYMPVLFYIDPKFSHDPKMKNIDDITLSYTFFRTEDS